MSRSIAPSTDSAPWSSKAVASGSAVASVWLAPLEVASAPVLMTSR